MSAFYDRMAATALRLIAQFGQPVSLQVIQVGDYDPETGTSAPSTTLEQTVSGVLIEYTGQEYQNSTLIQQGDKKLKVAAHGLAWAPNLSTKAVIQGKTWVVFTVKEINPAGTPLVYELQVRA